jgi:hypothetical protein
VTTKHSPLSTLKRQADQIAAIIMAAERGEKIDIQFAEKIEAARGRPAIKVGVLMDDKTIMLELPWSTIRSSGEAGLAAYILKQMREQQDDS